MAIDPEHEHDVPSPGRPSLLTRREAIRRVTALLGGVALVGGEGLLTGCRPEAPAEGSGNEEDAFALSDAQVALLDEIAETILPATSTPGAKAAATGAFMALSVRDVYSLEDREVFLEGMRRLEGESEAMHGRGFMEASPEERLALLEHLDREQHAYMQARAEARRSGESPLPHVTAESPAHYFRMMKELALLGYFTSEIGYRQAQRYVETPGRFDPCVPYAPGDQAWAPHA